MTSRRQCPLCEPSPTYEEICPFHAVPTVDIEIFDLPVGSVSVGAAVAGRYKVERALESGGMGTVLIAKQIGVNRTVALKVLRPDRPVDLPLLRRFYNEAHAISSLSHPNIVQVFDFGFDPALRVPYLAMEYVEGSTLDRMLDAGPLAERRAARLLAQVARALVEAHSAGIVHRDLKPANVMVSRLRDGEEHVKVLDFGVAKIVRAERDGLTAPGMTLGSPHYMSPEQARAEAIDGRADLYSLGCVMYELLTAQAPFDAQATMEVMSKQVHAPRPPLPERLIADKRAPAEATRLLYDALLAKRREDRPGSASTVAKILAAIAQGAPIDVLRVLEDERTERTLIAGQAIGGATPSGEKTAATMPAFNLVIPGRGEADRLRILNAATAVPTPEMEVATDKSVPTLPSSVESTPVLGQVALPTLIRPPPRGRQLGLAAAMFALVVLGAAIGAFLWSQRDGGSVEPAPIAPALVAEVIDAGVPLAAPVRADVPPPPVELDAGVAPPVKKKARTPPPVPAPLAAAATGREIRIVTEPAGATVLRDGTTLGTTPVLLRLASGESAALVIKKQGFLERKVSVQEDSPALLKLDLVPVW